jgi:hypothetical protein
MDPREALQRVHAAASVGRIHTTKHADRRMFERGVHFNDLLQALRTSSQAVWQTDNETWLLCGGQDFDGEGLSIVVKIEHQVVVVTVIGD